MKSNLKLIYDSQCRLYQDDKLAVKPVIAPLKNHVSNVCYIVDPSLSTCVFGEFPDLSYYLKNIY